jgi:putative transposase
MFSYDPLKSILALLPRSLESAQYLSAAYVEQLTAHGIHSSVGRPGTCWDNAVPESFFAILKNELLYRAS